MYLSLRLFHYSYGRHGVRDGLCNLKRQISSCICNNSMINKRTSGQTELFRVLCYDASTTRSSGNFLQFNRNLTVKAVPGFHENISALQMKKRPQRKKRLFPAEEELSKPGFWSAVAYATAEEYDLEKMMKNIVDQNLYDVTPIDSTSEQDTSTNRLDIDVIHATAQYTVGSEPREVFIFREGTAVFWNMDELERSNLLACFRSFEENSYDEILVQSESDVMPYAYADSRPSCIKNGIMLLNSEGSFTLDKYTFSNSMALSVKLGIWEASLDKYVDSIEFVTEDMKRGQKIKMSREDVLRKTGELFALRHLINLSSDLLDTPDFYWDREIQEKLYNQTCNFFSIQKRTNVMNEKLNHCLELVELLSTHLSDEHHVRLEWMIIILIMVEVGFEVIHYIDRFS